MNGSFERSRYWRVGTRLTTISANPCTALNFFSALLFLVLPGPAGADPGPATDSSRSRLSFTQTIRDQSIMGEASSDVQATVLLVGVRFVFRLGQTLGSPDLRFGDDSPLKLATNADDRQRLERTAGRIFVHEPQTRLGITMFPLRSVISADLDWVAKAGDRHDLSVGLQFRPFHSLDFRIARSWLNPMPSYTELIYETASPDGTVDRELGNINWIVPAAVTEASFHLIPNERLRFESLVRKAQLRPLVPTSASSPSGKHEAVVDGWYDESRMRLAYYLNKDSRGTAEFRRYRASTRLRAFEGGRRYAYFGILRGEGRFLSLGVERRNLFIQLRFGQMSGQVAGVVDAWPFAAGLLRFLGQRRHFVGAANINGLQTSCGGDFRLSHRLRIRADVSWLHLVPKLDYKTWRPIAFGFGFDDLKTGSLDIEKLEVLRLHLRPSIRCGRYLAELDLSQWIPVLTSRAEGEDVSAPPPRLSNYRRVWNGFGAAVTVRLEL